jgi:hypothetical protein
MRRQEPHIIEYLLFPLDVDVENKNDTHTDSVCVFLALSFY